MLDSHTHSSFSMDSTAESDSMVRRAIELGLSYYAITDHYNRDFDNILPKYRVDSKELKYPLDVEGHLRDVERLSKVYGDKIYVAAGIEMGYSRDSEDSYIDTLDMDRIDVIVNSIHTMDGEDIYYDIFYSDKVRERVLRRYLELVRESVESKVNFNIIGHIGYISRKAPYVNNLLTMDEFGREIDDILLAIIRRDKCLECNAKSKNTPFLFLPGEEIIKRYFELGGRRISYGSDAHNPSRIAEKFDEIASYLKGVGFEGFTYYKHGEPHLEKF